MLVSTRLRFFARWHHKGHLEEKPNPACPGQGSKLYGFLLKQLPFAISFLSVVLCRRTARDYYQKEGISNTHLSHLQYMFIFHPSCTLSLCYLSGINKWKCLEMTVAGPDTEAGLF